MNIEQYDPSRLYRLSSPPNGLPAYHYHGPGDGVDGDWREYPPDRPDPEKLTACQTSVVAELVASSRPCERGQVMAHWAPRVYASRMYWHLLDLAFGNASLTDIVTCYLLTDVPPPPVRLSCGAPLDYA